MCDDLRGRGPCRECCGDRATTRSAPRGAQSSRVRRRRHARGRRRVPVPRARFVVPRARGARPQGVDGARRGRRGVPALSSTTSHAARRSVVGGLRQRCGGGRPARRGHAARRAAAPASRASVSTTIDEVLMDPEPTFDEERHVVDGDDARRAPRPLLRDPLGDGRPGDGVERLKGVAVGEDDGGQPGPVERAVGADHVVAEALANLLRASADPARRPRAQRRRRRRRVRRAPPADARPWTCPNRFPP